MRTLGAGPDRVVAICLDRSLAMIVGQLAILKAGVAYLPLDPAYPAERLASIVDDAQAVVLLTHQQLAARFAASQTPVVCLDQIQDVIAGNPTDNPTSDVTPAHLAYVIYTAIHARTTVDVGWTRRYR